MNEPTDAPASLLMSVAAGPPDGRSAAAQANPADASLEMSVAAGQPDGRSAAAKSTTLAKPAAATKSATRTPRPGGPGGPPADTQSLTLEAFCRRAGIGPKRIYRHYGSWAELCGAAGLKVRGRPRSRLADDQVLRDIHDAIIASDGAINRRKLHRRLAFGPGAVNRRWGNWTGALAALLDWVDREAPGFPYREALAKRAGHLAGRRLPSREPAGIGPPWPSVGGRPAGAPLNYRAMAFAPANELGVVLLFGMVAGDLGYAIDTVQPGFPDITAKRRVSDTRWESVRIEVEYRSIAFLRHGHDPAGCDVVVCWQHDWPDCPLEVLCLRDAVKGV